MVLGQESVIGTSSRPSRWHRYPPLAGALLAVVMAALVLPSALRVPLSNPTQTLEFAPIPPQEDDPPPVEGSNVASLGLGSSSTSPSSGAASGVGERPAIPTPPPPAPGGVGDWPTTKRCVGTPPRQTEDLMSPPCVAHFDGDNGGATYTGVTGDEIQVVVYFDGNSCQPTSRGVECSEPGRLDDLGKPATGADEFVYSRHWRAYQRWFNERFQTYGRSVHIWVQYSSVPGAEATPETRRADAADQVRDLKPFAAISYARQSSGAYVNAMADHGVVTFIGLLSGISSMGQPASFFTTFPGLAWSYVPSLDQRAHLFATLACERVMGHAVSFSGQGENGQTRRLGIIRQTGYEGGLAYWGEKIKQQLEDCGADFIDGAALLNEDPPQSAQIMARFRQAQVTTIIHAAPSDQYFSHAAAAINYFPEWVIAGDDIGDRPIEARLNNQDAYTYARAMTMYPRVTDVEAMPCIGAYREVDSEEGYFQVRNFACDFYLVAQQLFTAIQVAGPRLTPESVDRGFHAIPAVRSDDPRIVACYYDPGDYTCVKDAQTTWWDAQGRTPGSNQPGCWRSMQDGRRYVAGTWSPGDIDSFRSVDDQCSAMGPDVA